MLLKKDGKLSRMEERFHIEDIKNTNKGVTYV